MQQLNRNNSNSATNAVGSKTGAGRETLTSGRFFMEVKKEFGSGGPRFNHTVGFSKQQLYLLFTNLTGSSRAEVDACLIDLFHKGMVYNTIDDDHFQLTE